ncbi:methyltransferase FkbM [Kribbella sp. ALI-6-A]|uniref:FkbM family methyltransferase n=1 Tax=Kribbella sp. ALI-6-A TaxID=1933817 RepID=UPI00097BC9B9|nr:FkbM family methyltransferase [Kribbella sp. ALI-6-A]ONI67526.1 methyltransferase FkbM [Kribbella sp. ALI-6-A]
MVDVRDGRIGRLAWRLPYLAERVGDGAARRVAHLVGRVEGARPGGVQRVALRVSPRLAQQNPGLTKISPDWAVDEVDVRRQGVRLRLDLRDNLQAVLYYAGRYEPATARFLAGELRAGDVFLDVGANIGVHTLGAALRMRDLSSGRVIAFEPADDALAKLQQAAERNGLGELIETVQAALGDSTRDAVLRADSRYDVADTGVRSLVGDGEVVQQVPVVRLDDWSRAHDLTRLDVMKLDVEGSELAVLRGAAHTMTRLRPRAVLVEDKREDQRRELYAVLDRLGYRPHGQLLDHNRLFRRDRSPEPTPQGHAGG